MEYDAAESDNDSDRQLLPGWTGSGGRTGASEGSEDANWERELHTLCVFDPVEMPPWAQRRSYLVSALNDAPLQRKWTRWRWREQPDLASVRGVEAVMLYERGVDCRTEQRCTRCRAGEGMSPQCVVLPRQARTGEEAVPCSNCLYDGVASGCSSFAGVGPAEDRDLEDVADATGLVDHMAVLELIARLKRPPGMRRDQSLPARARRIEIAALHIAQAAREWGHKMAMER